MNFSAPNQFSDSFLVAAYITAYEDGEALHACISAIQAQSYPVQQILVVDNSPQALPLSPSHQSEPSLLVWHHPENLGIAGGLEMAFNWAAAQGFDFLWTFDQDSTPASDCLALLLEAYSHLAGEDYPIGIVAPTAIDTRTGEIVKPSLFLGDRFWGFLPPNPTAPYECDAPITSGSLVQMQAAQQIPPPDRQLFIDGIDLDYGLRLRKAGFHNIVVPAAQMYHRFGIPFQIELLGRKKAFQLYPPLRYYYICRNQTYLELIHSQGRHKLTCILRRIKYLIMTILKILVFDSGSEIEKVRACIVGTYHGFAGKLGKRW
ncbi:glycosyltransferase family 2 protein [Leptothermofonsia sp. ETS-13]|uniref:glycosyltransferase family 2 protein n=1 Tax=Leptothermofonsia sp. ETS-13 TaxID=3035696 RepID=UPI003B9DE071